MDGGWKVDGWGMEGEFFFLGDLSLLPTGDKDPMTAMTS